MIELFGFNHHRAPGEAEAECAALQKAGVVDAVFSDDGDTFMFGASVVLRNWTAEGKTGSHHGRTHVNLHSADDLVNRFGLHREGFVTMAMMSGGDYSDGIKGIGIKLAAEVARTDLGRELCSIRDRGASLKWKDSLQEALRSNREGLFKMRHPNLTLPGDWPDLRVLQFYNNPVVSSIEAIRKLTDGVAWDTQPRLQELRFFVADVFEWQKSWGLRTFIRGVAPALLLYQLAHGLAHISLPLAQTRRHLETDGALEFRVAYVPAEVVTLAPEDEGSDDEEDNHLNATTDDDPQQDEHESADTIVPLPSESHRSGTKPRYNSGSIQRAWILETWVAAGLPELLRRWQDDQSIQTSKLNGGRHNKSRPSKKSTRPDPQHGAMDKYVRLRKPQTVPCTTMKAPAIDSITKPVPSASGYNPLPTGTKSDSGRPVDPAPAQVARGLARSASPNRELNSNSRKPIFRKPIEMKLDFVSSERCGLPDRPTDPTPHQSGTWKQHQSTSAVFLAKGDTTSSATAEVRAPRSSGLFRIQRAVKQEIVDPLSSEVPAKQREKAFNDEAPSSVAKGSQSFMSNNRVRERAELRESLQGAWKPIGADEYSHPGGGIYDISVVEIDD